MKSVFEIIILLIVLLQLVSSQSNGLCKPTPLNFPVLFHNGCTGLERSNEECDSVWMQFSSAFANKNPNVISNENYENYFDMFEIDGQRNTFLFWSQTIKLAGMLSCMCEAANVFSGPNYFPVAIMDKIAGELDMPMTDLRWCGTENGGIDGIQYTDDCPCNTSYAFFQEFSIRFGRAAEGIIFYLSFGESEKGAFPDESFFAEFEIDALNSMNPNAVDRAVVLVMHNRTSPNDNENTMSESCGEGSLETLRQRLADRGINDYSCYDLSVNGFSSEISNPSLVELTNCAANIITSEQQNTEPAANECFVKEIVCRRQRRDQTDSVNVCNPLNAGLTIQNFENLTLLAVSALLVIISLL